MKQHEADSSPAYRRLESSRITMGKLRAIFVCILLFCSLHCLTAQSEPLTLHLIGCVPERMEICVPQGSIYAEPVLETNSDDVSLKVYKCTYDERYTVLCVEHT